MILQFIFTLKEGLYPILGKNRSKNQTAQTSFLPILFYFISFALFVCYLSRQLVALFNTEPSATHVTA